MKIYIVFRIIKGVEKTKWYYKSAINAYNKVISFAQFPWGHYPKHPIYSGIKNMSEDTEIEFTLVDKEDDYDTIVVVQHARTSD
jgi:hypothetical protein